MPMHVHTFGVHSAKNRGLWVHGWMGSGLEGEALQKSLGDDFQLCCPDLPGHGETPLKDWDLSATLSELARFAGKGNWAGGYSMGGRLLMMTAARFPQSVFRLVIESAGLGFSDPKLRAERRQLDHKRGELLKERGLSAFCKDWYQMEMWGGAEDFPMREGKEEGLARALERFSVGNQPDLRLWLQSTPRSVLWLAGERDPVYSEQAQWVKQHTRHPVEMLDTGHNIHHQHPEAWAEKIKTFLRKKPGGRVQ